MQHYPINMAHPHIPGTGHANRTRSLVKTVSWRTIGTIDTILIATFVTGNPGAGVAIGGIEVFTKMILYYFHERGWSWIDWGLEDEIPSNLTEDAPEIEEAIEKLTNFSNPDLD